MQLHCLLAYFLLTVELSLAFYTRVQKSGPATSWIQRPEHDDMRRMNEICSPPAYSGGHLIRSENSTASNDRAKVVHPDAEHNPSLRIMNGEGAQRGMFPYAAALASDVTFMGWFAHCGATLISRRHLITAAHCIGNQE